MKGLLLLLLSLPLCSEAQIITTIAGDGTRGNSGNNGMAVHAALNKPVGVSVDDSGTVYITDAGNDDIRKVAADGTISIYIRAFRRSEMYSYKGKEIKVPGIANGVSVDTSGTVYFSDSARNMIRKMARDGTVTTIAGTGDKGYSGDGGDAIRARINTPWGVATDESGNVFFADMNNNVVRKINSKGIITTIAGSGTRGYDGDRGQATDAKLNEPRGVAVDHNGNVYIADSRNDAIRMVNTDGVISTFAGNGRRLYHLDDELLSPVAYMPDDGHHGDGGPATKAQLYWPYDVAPDKDGNLYIADASNHVVRKVTGLPEPKKETPPVKETFNVSADPEKGTLIVTTDSGAYSSLTITGMNGKLLREQTITGKQTIVDISGLPPARYYINMKTGSKTKSAMFVKDK